MSHAYEARHRLTATADSLSGAAPKIPGRTLHAATHLFSFTAFTYSIFIMVAQQGMVCQGKDEKFNP
jgi:hypothetical protein